MNRLLCTAAILAAVLPAEARAGFQARPAAVATIHDFNIPAGHMDAALVAFGRQSGLQMMYASETTRGLRTAGVQGRMSSADALQRLLGGSGLSHSLTTGGAVVISRDDVSAALGAATALDDIVVTGTLLRGAQGGPSPVMTITRDRLDRDGHATVAQALAALPQNFGGTANEAAIGNGGDRTAANVTYASGVNLRGLGSDATLVLVNGRRLAGTGLKGDFADVSTIPTAAIERIDVLLDGASALYGSDAVGGVVNIILRENYEGAETRARIGATGDGLAVERQFGQTLGRRWSSGSLMGTYEFYDRDALEVSERRLAGDADLRWAGGTDRRLIFSNPGNIVQQDPATGAFQPRFGIPTGQNGVGLAPGDFLPGQANLTNPREGMNVLPAQSRETVFVAGRQAIGSALEVKADARLGRRDYETVSGPFSTVLTVNRGNPFFVSPTGASSHLIAYAFNRDLPNPRVEGSAESLGVSGGFEADLGEGWRLDAYLAYASETGINDVRGLVNTTLLREALGASADSPATTYSAPKDGFFNPFADGSNSSAAALAFISSGFSSSLYETEVETANLQLDGALLQLPGGPLRLAAGLSWRGETFARQVTGFTTGTAPNVGARLAFDREVVASFAELRLPLFGPANARPGLRRLELSAAARLESYDDSGRTTNPKVGVVWEPAEGLALKANYGRSFRAPALRELSDAASASPTFLPRGTQQVLSIILYGGNPDLEPETAETWTAGLDYRPAWAPGLRLGASAFRIDFDDRIGQPTFENILTAISDPAFAAFVQLVDPVADVDDRAAVQAILDRPTTNLRDAFPATAYGAIVDARFVNTESVVLEGLDIDVGYGFDIGRDSFDAGLTASLLDRFDSRSTPDASAISQLDRPNFPVSLRARGRLDWSREAWGATLGLNYVGGYRDLAGQRIDPWTTTDLQLRYSPAAGLFEGTTVALGVQNLLDQDPPFYDAPEGVGYDPANAHVLGRFVSLQLTRAW